MKEKESRLLTVTSVRHFYLRTMVLLYNLDIQSRKQDRHFKLNVSEPVQVTAPMTWKCSSKVSQGKLETKDRSVIVTDDGQKKGKPG